MHKYFLLRGTPKIIRRVIEDLQDLYYPYINKLTGKKWGMLQLMPREIKTYEMVFPATSKKDIKKDVMKIITEHSKKGAGIAIKWGPWKKDKYNKDGTEHV